MTVWSMASTPILERELFFGSSSFPPRRLPSSTASTPARVKRVPAKRIREGIWSVRIWSRR